MSEEQDTQTVQRPGKRRTGLLLAAAAVAVLLVVVLVYLFTRESHARGTPTQVVKAAQATRGDMPEMLSELATGAPGATVAALPGWSGYLTQVGYREAEDVAQGQLLAQI